MDKLKLLSSIVLATTLLASLLSTAHFVNAVTFTQKDNEAKEEISDGLSKISPSQIKTLTAETWNNQTIVVYNSSQAPPPSCPADQVWNSTSQKCDPIPPPPPTCPPNQFYNTTSHQCEDLPNPPPPPPPPTDKPSQTFNQSVIFRTVALGDIDNNAGLVTQLALANKYHTQLLLVLGDYGYKDCQGVVDKLKAAGFTSTNSFIIQGNHDCDKVTLAFNGMQQLYGAKTFGKVAVFAIDGNSALDCNSAQFKALKLLIEKSNATYKIAAIHQPFVTGPSTHGDNKQFSCWDPVFRANKVHLVLEAHNHNYQRFSVNGIDYNVVGTGTHDTNGNMYPIKSNAQWNGFTCVKCFTGTNGVGLYDFSIATNTALMQAWFLSNNEQVMDSFS